MIDMSYTSVICTCGDLVKEVDTLFCKDCGDVTCLDCLTEGMVGDVYCIYCADKIYSGLEQSSKVVLMNILIDGKQYKSNFSSDLEYLSNFQNGFTEKLYLKIKGVGSFTFLYRMVLPIYNDEQEEIGDLYTLYFSKVG